MKKILIVFMVTLLACAFISCARVKGDKQTNGSETEQTETNETTDTGTDSESGSGGNGGSEDYGTPVTPIEDGGTYDYGK